MASVSRLSVTPVKGLALVDRDEVTLGPRGVAENRRFHLIDETGGHFGAHRCWALVRVRPAYDEAGELLAFSFPDGTRVEGSALGQGETVRTAFSSRLVTGTVVDGPFAEALSAYVRRPVQLVRASEPGFDVEPVTFLSDASLGELRVRAGRDEPVDGRRFRMLVGLADTEPHEEDRWEGRLLRVGEALVRVGGPVARCTFTTRSPDTGERDFDALRAIKAYRGLRAGKHIDFGVYGDVEQPGRVRVGDPVESIED